MCGAALVDSQTHSSLARTTQAAWTAAYDAVLAAALGEDPNVKPTTANLSAFICEQLAKAEPDVKPYASSFVGRHPLDHATLKVFHATEASMLSDGTTLRVRDGVETPDEVAGPVAVFVTGEAELSNPHGLKKDSEKGTSIAPLKSMSGDTFAVLVSGPPAVPDEFLESLARHAGPLLERVWKKEQVHCMVGNVMEFIKSFALSMSAMLRVTYEPDATVDFTPVIGDDSYVWKWQSFEYTDPNDPSSFVVCLAWRLGEPVGLLRVSCGTFTEMNEQIVTLLHTIAVVLQETVAEVRGRGVPRSQPSTCLSSLPPTPLLRASAATCRCVIVARLCAACCCVLSPGLLLAQAMPTPLAPETGTSTSALPTLVRSRLSLRAWCRH